LNTTCLLATQLARTISGSASSTDLPPSTALRSSSASRFTDSATIVFSTVLGSDGDSLDPSARNSNLLPVNANGLVRLRSPGCFSSSGSVGVPSSITASVTAAPL